MDPEVLKRLLPLYLDGELPTEDAQNVRAALDRDPGLRRLAAEYGAVDRLLELHPLVEPRPGFIDRTVTRVLAAEARIHPLPFRRFKVAASVAAAAILLAVVFLWRPWRGDESVTEAAVPLRDYGVLSASAPSPAPDLEAAYREIESIQAVFFPLR